MSDMERVTFSSDGLEIHGSLWMADRREKGTVLICHGAFETRENWTPLAERLNQEGFTVLTFDFAGHGSSQGPRGLVNLVTWAYNIRDAVNYLGSRGSLAFGLVGWESGGSAVLLAAAHDARLSCAAILSAPVYLLPTLADRVVYILASLVGKIKSALLHKPLVISRLNETKRLGIMPDEAASNAYFADPAVQAAYHSFPIPDGLDNVWIDITGAVKKVNIPVLVIQGSGDKIIPTSQGQMLYDLLPGRKEIKMMDGSGHALHLDRQKDAVFGMVSGWMKANLNEPGSVREQR